MWLQVILGQLAIWEVVGLALVLGASVGASLFVQLRLQAAAQQAVAQGQDSFLLRRLMHAGLSFALLCLAVIFGKYAKALSYPDFILIAGVAGGATLWWLLRRSRRKRAD